MKIAKLEIKIILSTVLLGYEYELVDGMGNYPKAVPNQDRNDLAQVSPPVHFNFSMKSVHLFFFYSRVPSGTRVIWNSNASLSRRDTFCVKYLAAGVLVFIYRNQF